MMSAGYDTLYIIINQTFRGQTSVQTEDWQVGPVEDAARQGAIRRRVNNAENLLCLGQVSVCLQSCAGQFIEVVVW